MSIRRAALLASTAIMLAVAAPIVSVQSLDHGFSVCSAAPNWPGCGQKVLS